MTTTSRKIVTTHGPWRGEWHGGAYIDVSHVTRPGHAVDCINVWDYAAGEATIPFTQRAAHRALRDWAESDSASDVLTHVLPYL